MGALEGKHVLVTGGGSGIGAAIAALFAAEGAKVTIAGRDRDKLIRTAASAGMLPVAADVTSESSVAELFEEAANRQGPPQIVVAAAGAAESAPFSGTGLDLWNRMIAVNLTGAFLTLKAGLAHMRGTDWGRAIIIASTASLKGYPYVAAYCAAKHGALGLARALAAETARSGITVNAVCPGFTETDLLDRALEKITQETALSKQEARTRLLAANPQGRFVSPAEVARSVLWLCGPDSAAITGQAISVSGGEI